MSEEKTDLLFAHVCRMSLVEKEHELFDPMEICLMGIGTEMSQCGDRSNPVLEFRLWDHCCT